MFLGRRSRRSGREELRTSDVFLNRCFRLIACWVAIFVLMVGFAAAVGIREESDKKWAGALFTISCILDLIATGKIIPMTLKMLRDPNYKETEVKKNIWKLRGLIFMNLLFALGFILWMWTAKKETTTDKLVKWLLFSCLAAGALAIKGCFIMVCIRLKKYMSRLFVDFRRISDDKPEDFPEPSPSHPDQEALPASVEEEPKLIS